ncbi:2-octaprenyl-6-methoxyphenyl hydroxylase [Pseudomarimonas salicorniae]|uniref:2-octaprenyl-6-methoxyphenyl hydroxylase n=1 Tax=Pseudomarimonas salicorniae TaxID=2933270 RepID=A0ABT0GH89_9GAMM|nr:2-octaprenyl-6-methoxyphenyl hydroxylase [Lysobacter sp. CAU 1642]
MEATTDVAVVGGGLVGCSLALALARSPWKTCLLEAAGRTTAAPPPNFDERNLALARASLDALERLGVLDRLPRRPEPITRIHISRLGDLGAVDLRASEHGVEALGGVVMARDLGFALQSAVIEEGGLEFRSEVRAASAEPVEGGWRLRLSDGDTLRCRLLVAADGSDSPLRERFGIACDEHDYGQQLAVCSVAPLRATPGMAWERFSSKGPVALLPRNDGRWGAVCGIGEDDAARVAAMDDAAYAGYLQQRFGWRAGRLDRPGRRTFYPLRSRIARRLVDERAVLVGNAAQTLHPIGAQGFNLGLRDALTLASTLREADDPGAARALEAYSAARQPDRDNTWRFADGLARLTASDGAAAHLLRSLGLIALGASRMARTPLVEAAMGLHGMPAEWRAPA